MKRRIKKYLEGVSTKQKIFQICSIILVSLLSVLIILLRSKLEGLKDYGYAGLFLVSTISSASIILPVPGLFLVFSFGAVLNPLIVGIVSAFGSALGEVTGYILGYGGRIAVEDRDKYEKVSEMMRRWGSWTILFLALIPNPLFDIAGIISGMLKYPLWKFLLYTLIGRIIKHIVFAYAGFYSLYYFF
ncbi:VTT domain-containing protein [candidate division WOR-3 bacterium]|nr:VTT domain-containing protein [candidate division WOR-3 bacterium]